MLHLPRRASGVSMDESRSSCLTGIAYLLACNIIYMYFLDWNIMTLIIRGLQLFSVFKGSRREEVVQQMIFFTMVVLSNLPVLLLHLFSGKLQPLVLVFVGNVELSSRWSLFFNDLIIMGLETSLILNSKFVKM